MKFLLAIGVGLGIGLAIGWGLLPVKFVDTSPATLREDFRADYMLMIAETYQADRNLDLAARRLAILGSEHPSQIATQALQYGLQAGYPPGDIQLLQHLALALQTWQP
ncbi:MAG: hypothetical protein ABIJ39_04570 [Chloroflexota bacterium]